MLNLSSIQLGLLRARKIKLVQLIAIPIPIFWGAGLGFLISRGDWIFAFILATFAPLTMLFITRPFVGVGVWLVLMPFSTIMPDQGQLIYWGLHRLLIALSLCVSIMPRLARSSRFPRFRLRLPEVCMSLLAAYVPLSIIFSGLSLDNLSKGYLDNILVPILMYLLIRLSILDHWKYELLTWTVLFIAISQCAIGLISWLVPGILPSVWLHYFQTRFSGSLLNPNTYAVVLVFCGLILFHSAMNRQHGLIRAGFLLTCVLIVLCVFLTMERAVWLGTAAALVGLFFLYPKQTLRYLTICMVILTLFGAGLLSEKIAQASERIENQTNVDIRIVLTDAMFRMIQARPVLGWGFGSINQNINQYYRQVDSFVLNRYEVSHNTYLTIFTELGLVGFTLFILPVVWLFSASLRVWRASPHMKTEHRTLLGILWLALLQHFIVCNFMDMRFFPIGMTFWWMNLGLIANLIQEQLEILT